MEKSGRGSNIPITEYSSNNLLLESIQIHKYSWHTQHNKAFHLEVKLYHAINEAYQERHSVRPDMQCTNDCINLVTHFHR